MAVSQLRVMMIRAGVNNFLQRIATTPSRHSLKTKSKGVSKEEPDELDQPIVYSESPAATWAARHSFSGGNNDRVPWFQGPIVAASTAIFLIYFIYVREANDIDAIFDRELKDYFDAVDNEQLQRKIAKNTAALSGRT